MRKLLALTILSITGTATHAGEWRHVGGAPYGGTAEQAIDRLPGLGPNMRACLTDKYHRGAWDDTVIATKNGVRSESGKFKYLPTIADLNFGDGSKIWPIATRESWADTDQIMGRTYSCGDTVATVWSVCGNWARLYRIIERQPAGGGGRDGLYGAPGWADGASPGGWYYGAPATFVPAPNGHAVPASLPMPRELIETPPLGVIEAPPAYTYKNVGYPVFFDRLGAPLSPIVSVVGQVPTGIAPWRGLIPVPVAAVAEPADIALYGIGLAMVAIGTLKRRGRLK